MAIQYVGGRGAGRAGSTSTVNVAINSGLTGGIGSAAQAGDLVIVTVAVATQGRNPSCAVSGYTPLTQQHTTATTYDISVCTSYKFMPATPDTQVTIPSTGDIADGQGYEIHVFRGVDPTVPLDGVTPTYLTGSGTNNRPDPQSITPATAGAWIYFGGGGAASTGTTVFTASYLSGFLSHNGSDTNDGTAGAGYYSGWSSGPYDGAVWAGGNVATANSWGCTTLVLRPAVVAQEVTGAGQISSAEAHGSPAVSATVAASGIATAEAFGQPTVAPAVSPQEVTGAGGIATEEAHGQPAVSLTVAAAGIVTAEALGQPAIAAAVQAAGIPTGEIIGEPSLSAVFVSAGIVSAEAFGQPTVVAVGGAQEITGVGDIPSVEIFGSPTVSRQAAPQPGGGGGIYFRRSRGPGVYFTIPDGKKKKKAPPVPPKPKPEEPDTRRQVTLRALEKIARAGKSYQRKPIILIDRKLLKFKALPRIAGVGGIPSQEAFGRPTLTLIDGGTRYEKALEEMLLIWTA